MTAFTPATLLAASVSIQIIFAWAQSTEILDAALFYVRLYWFRLVLLATVDCAHTKIISIDTEAASKVAGVKAVMTAADLPQPVPR